MEVIVIVIVIVEVEVEVEVYHRGALAMRKQAYNLFFRYQTTQVIVMLKVYVKVPMCSPVWPCWCFSAPMLQRRTQTPPSCGIGGMFQARLGRSSNSSRTQRVGSSRPPPGMPSRRKLTAAR
jgi:hypothetical protein